MLPHRRKLGMFAQLKSSSMGKEAEFLKGGLLNNNPKNYLISGILGSRAVTAASLWGRLVFGWMVVRLLLVLGKHSQSRPPERRGTFAMPPCHAIFSRNLQSNFLSFGPSVRWWVLCVVVVLKDGWWSGSSGCWWVVFIMCCVRIDLRGLLMGNLSQRGCRGAV